MEVLLLLLLLLCVCVCVCVLETSTYNYHSLTIFMQSLYYYNFAETKCYVVWDVIWQNVHYKQSVLQVQGHTAVVVHTSLSVFVLCSSF